MARLLGQTATLLADEPLMMAASRLGAKTGVHPRGFWIPVTKQVAHADIVAGFLVQEGLSRQVPVLMRR